VSARVVAVLARRSGSLPADLATAMLGDVIDLVAETPMVATVLAIAADGPSGYAVAPQSLTWPGTIMVDVSADPSAAEVLAAVAESLAAEPRSAAGGPGSPEVTEPVAIAVVAADVPDLPTLLLGKAFSALAGARGAAVAVCPAEAGGLVAVAVRVPLAGWLAESGFRLDDLDALAILRRAAPDRQLSVCPGWRRVRAPGDVVHLDPGLEGWDATRTLLNP
jgi:2-phospho-L-lactate guanylyltransferase (CobY/MobA/RfbA family)